jgi:hypothetical protein
MQEKYFLLVRFERELATPMMFDSRDEARAAMKESLIEAMYGYNDSVFDEYTKETDYDWEPNSDYAWFTHRLGDSDWKIVSFSEIQWHTEKVNYQTAKNHPG